MLNQRKLFFLETEPLCALDVFIRSKSRLRQGNDRKFIKRLFFHKTSANELTARLTDCGCANKNDH